MKMRKVQKRRTKKKKLTRSQLVRSLDKVFSIYIRQRDKGVCFTCGKRDEWKFMQNGHFISRGKFATRWDEDNCHCQCIACNIFKNGNYTIYAERLIDVYGEGIIHQLNRRGQSIQRWGSHELQERIEYYKQKIKEGFKEDL